MENNTKNHIQIQLSRCFYLLDATNQACKKQNIQQNKVEHKVEQQQNIYTYKVEYILTLETCANVQKTNAQQIL